MLEKRFAIEALDGFYSTRLSHHLLQPALTRTCKAVREETLPVFYGSNSFKLYSHHRYFQRKQYNWLRPWLEAIGRNNIDLMGRIVVCVNEERAEEFPVHWYSNLFADWAEEAKEEDKQCGMNVLSETRVMTHYVFYPTESSVPSGP